MKRLRLAAALLTLAPCAAQRSPEEWGAPPVRVSHASGKWTIAGRKQTAVLDEADLSIVVQAGKASWRMVPSSAADARRRMALHQRVGLLEMVNHEFLDAKRIRERTTFAEGTTVTVDWDAKSVAIDPELRP